MPIFCTEYYMAFYIVYTVRISSVYHTLHHTKVFARRRGFSPFPRFGNKKNIRHTIQQRQRQHHRPVRDMQISRVKATCIMPNTFTNFGELVLLAATKMSGYARNAAKLRSGNIPTYTNSGSSKNAK